jgi:hypothetical protein
MHPVPGVTHSEQQKQQQKSTLKTQSANFIVLLVPTESIQQTTTTN